MDVQKTGKRRKAKSAQWIGEHFFSIDFPDEFWPVERHGSQFQIRVQLGLVDDKIAAIGIDLTSCNDPKQGSPKPLPGRDAYAALNSSRWRAVPIGWYIDQAIAKQREEDSPRLAKEIRAGAYGVDDPERVAQLHDDLAQTPSAHKRLGRPSPLTDELLREVVYPAYKAGGSKPVVAVREALTAHGFAGAGAAGEVTIDQARKAVQQARRIGAIPPAHTNRKVRP